MCNAYIRIAKTCPPHIWKPESLIYILLSSKPCLPLIDCFQAALSIPGPNCVGAKTSDTSVVSSTSSDKKIENVRVRGKRPIQDQDIWKSKRQKLEEESMASDVEVHVSCKLSHIVTCERGQEHANYMHISLLSFVELLKPHVVKDKPFRPEVSLTALSMLCIVFSKYQYVIFHHLTDICMDPLDMWAGMLWFITWSLTFSISVIFCWKLHLVGKTRLFNRTWLSIYLEPVHCVLQSKAMDLIFFKIFMKPSFGFKEM